MLDLEDAVLYNGKSAARELVAKAVKGRIFGRAEVSALADLHARARAAAMNIPYLTVSTNEQHRCWRCRASASDLLACFTSVLRVPRLINLRCAKRAPRDPPPVYR